MYLTPHNEANPQEIAPIVLMPGDPLRAKFIAENYLENPVCFNKVRNMFGYTGTYKGIPVSVMGSGMGMPSIGIYSYELYTQYNVEVILRIGTCGGYTKDLHTFDVLVADSCWSASTYALAQSNDPNEIQYPDKEVTEVIQTTAKENNIPTHLGRMHSSDVFYYEPGMDDQAVKHDCLGVEMESFALFHNANVTHKKAACICTVSNSFVYDEDTTPAQRETSLQTMITLALETAKKLGEIYV